MKKRTTKKRSIENDNEPRNRKCDLPVPSTSHDPDAASCNSATEMSSIGEECLEHDSNQDNTSISTIITCCCEHSEADRGSCPSEFDDDDLCDLHLMQNCFDEMSIGGTRRCRHGNRKNLTFTNDRLREIERENFILLKKIMKCKPSRSSSRTSLSYMEPVKAPKVASSAVNRKKKQQQINHDNQILCRKLEAIRRKKPAV